MMADFMLAAVSCNHGCALLLCYRWLQLAAAGRTASHSWLAVGGSYNCAATYCGDVHNQPFQL